VLSLNFIKNIARINLQLVLLLTLILTETYALTIVQIGDTVGLPYPEITQSNIFLKEASVRFDTVSQWERQTSGFEPLHSIKMKMDAEYVIQNDGEETDLRINIPLMTPLDESSFTLNELAINYSSVEYASPRQTGTGVNLYKLDLVIPEGTSVLEVDAISRGIGGSEVDFSVLLRETSMWPKPIEKLVISSAHVNGLITGYSIPPSKTTFKTADWEFNNVVLDKDLTIKWKITELPTGTNIDVAKVQPPNPILPPIIAIVVGGAIIGYIAYLRVKRKRSASVN
jgi:hypothetical protein